MTENRRLKVFLCHSKEDKPKVRELYLRLITDGFDVWFDEEKLLPGQDWEFEIRKAVRQADAIVVCLSQESITKEGFVQKEIKFALDVADEKPEGAIYLIPARIEICEVPSRLSRWQWVDLFNPKGYILLMQSLKMWASDVKAIIIDRTEDDFDNTNSVNQANLPEEILHPKPKYTQQPVNETPSSNSTTKSSQYKESQPQLPKHAPVFWKNLSIGQRQDVIGVVLALVGLLTFLSLLTTDHSALTGGMIRFLGQVFGWGIYILPTRLIGIGIWLVLRNTEQMPTFLLIRFYGIILLFFWLLTVLHAVIATPELAEQAALDGVGGGYFGSLFERLLWPSLGSGGAIVAMVAWLLIGLALILDYPITDLAKKIFKFRSKSL